MSKKILISEQSEESRSRGKRVLILGGGFGGVRVALDLSKLLPNEEITLINDSFYHTFTPDLYELTTAKLSQNLNKNFEEVLTTVDIPLKDIFEKKKVEILIGKVVGIDLNKKIVTIKGCGSLGYDFLVIALGCTTCFYQIPGAKNFSHPLKTAEDALNIRDDLSEMLLGNKNPTVLVAGGGFTGVELAGNLSLFLRKKGEVIVLEAGGQLLSGMPDWARRKALKRLEDLGVKVKFGYRIKKVIENEIVSETGEKVTFDYLVWTTGIEGVGIGINGVKLTNNSQIEVGEDLSVKGFPEVYVCGDISSLVPSTAWAAIAQGKLVAKNIKALLYGRSTKPYVFPKSVFVVPVGGKYALSNIFGLRLSGFLPWVLKQLISLRYFLSILPLGKALRLWIKGVRDLA